jgi:hypothetical protein
MSPKIGQLFKELRVRVAVGLVVLAILTPIAALTNTAGAAEATPDPVAAQYARCQQDLAAKPAPSGSYLTWLNNCTKAFAPTTASPTSSPSATIPAPSPTPTPSVSSTSPTPSPNVSPTPSPSPSNQLNCMDDPAGCGFPDVTNTGVPMGAVLTSSGSLTLDQVGRTYSNLNIHGCVNITAANVTLTRSLITGCTSPYAVRLDSDTLNFTMTDSEIVLQGDQKGLVFRGYTARRLKITGIGDCYGAGNNVLIQDTYCENGPGNSPKRAPSYGPEPTWCGSGAHWDGVEVGDTRSTIIRHNTFRLPCGQTGTINVSDWSGPTTGVVLDGNLLAGGSWTVYCGSPTTGVTLTNTRFSRWFWPGGGSANNDEATQGYCWSATRSGNVWDDTGKAV